MTNILARKFSVSDQKYRR